MNAARFQLFAGFQVLDAAGDPLALTAKKSIALLVYVLLSAGRRVSRDKLLALLWEDSATEQARASLRQALFSLRKRLPDGVLQADQQYVWLDESTITCDVSEFEATAQSKEFFQLEEAVALYQGDLLDGFFSRAQAFEDWIRLERLRLREMATTAFHSVFQAYTTSGQLDEGIAVALKLLSLEPLQEDVHRQLMELYAQTGRRSTAIKQFGVLQTLLQQELGVQPEEATLQVLDSIRRGGIPPLSATSTGEQLLVDNASLEEGSSESLHRAELRQVTIVVVSLSEPENMGDAKSLSELRRLMQKAQDLVVEEIQHVHGKVFRRRGNTLMAVYGVPVARGRETEMAAQAALAIHERLQRDKDQLLYQANLGIANGSVLVQWEGDSFTLQGEALTQAAMMQAQAHPGTTYLTRQAWESLRLTARGIPLPDQESSSMWQLLALGEQPTTSRTQFVGRLCEAHLMQSALQLCLQQQRGQTVLLQGEAGIGKSRLAQHTVDIAEQLGFHVIRATILDADMRYSEEALRALLQALLSMEQEFSPADSENARFWEGLRATEQAVLSDVLQEELSLAQKTQLNALDARTRGRILRQVVIDLLRFSNKVPLLLLLEDVHWVSPALLDIALQCVEFAARSRLFFLMTSRLEGTSIFTAWQQHRISAPFVIVPLYPLSQEEAVLMAEQFPEHAPGWCHQCIERAGGNPLFLEQLLHAASQVDTLPGAVHSTVQARLDRLESTERAALQAASVLGLRFALEALRYLLEDSTYQPDALLAEALLQPDAESEYFQIAHALIREAVEATILPERRKQLNQRAAQWFVHRDPVAHAQHLAQAGVKEAGSAFLAAAQRHLETHSDERALQLAEEGLHLGSEEYLPVLLEVRAEALLRLGRTMDALRGFEESLQASQHKHERCKALLGMASALRIVERGEQALEVLDTAQELAGAHDLYEERSQIHYLRGSLLFPVGDLDGCMREHSEALRLATLASSPIATARALSGLGDACYQRGHINTAYEHYTRCLEVARAHGLGRIVTDNLSMQAITLLFQADANQSYTLALESFEQAVEVGNHRAQMVALSNLTDICFVRGDWANLETLGRQCLKVSQDLGASRFAAYAQAYLGCVRVIQGEQEPGMAILGQTQQDMMRLSPTFVGPMIVGMMAWLSHNEELCHQYLMQGITWLKQPCVSHNYLFFYTLAALTYLRRGEPESALSMAAKLREYTAEEPIPWSALVYELVALLSSYDGTQPPPKTLRPALLALHSQIMEADYGLFRPIVENAIAGRAIVSRCS